MDARFGRYVKVRVAAALGLVATLALVSATAARAGTYSAAQCSPGVSAVSPGWSTYGVGTLASTSLSNTCSSGGAIGDFAFSNGQAGAVTEDGDGGSQVGLELGVPQSAPDVTIQSIHAQVIASSTSGDDAFLGFSAAGQGLSGAVELPYGGGDYTNTESWTLPQGARDFEASVYCTTDRSSTTCQFPDSAAIPALNDVTLTLSESTPPAVASVSGTLASAATSKLTIAGTQAINFVATDADSGVRSATLTLSPDSGGAATVHTFDFSAECAYDAWNACPKSQTVSGFGVNTATLAHGSYAVELSVVDAAGNVANDELGSVDVENASGTTTTLGALPGPGSSQSPTAGSTSATATIPSAQLQLGSSRTIARSFLARALSVPGRLLSEQGQPIVGATVDVIQSVPGLSGSELIGRTITRSNGTFVASVPPGPSRTIELAYGPSAGGTFAAEAKLAERVSAGVNLKITPRRTGSNGTITLSGSVNGPVPESGVLVVLLVHYRGHWVPFRKRRSDANGHFRAEYAFEGGVGRFPFRAEVPAGQAGFPYGLGLSRVVEVSSG